MNYAQRDKPQLPDGRGIGRQQLCIFTTQYIARNATMRHVDSSPKDKTAQQPQLAAPKSTPPPFGPRDTNTLSRGSHTHEPVRASIEDP